MKYINPFTAVFTWNNYDTKVYDLQHKIKQITGQCIVIASHDTPKRKRFDWYYVGENAYYTKQWNKSIELFKAHQQYNTFVQIQGDASINDLHKFYDQLEKSYEKYKWGIYTPYIDFSPHYHPLDDSVSPDGYKQIERTDCTAWAINEFIIKQGVDSFNENKYKYGWGIDKYYNNISIKSKLPIIIDYNIKVDHPKSSNYEHTIPFQEADEMEREFTNKELKISLCTTCGNRLYDLKYTTPFNLEFIKKYGKKVEWIIIDYGSTNVNEVRDYVNSIQAPDNLDIVFKRIDEKWNMGRAKYASHDIASGDILINLDSDNFLGIGYLDHIYEIFDNNPLSIAYFEWENKFIQLKNNYGVDFGYIGKVAVSKGIYKSTCGYPIDINGYGGDDTDLVYRVKEISNVNIVCLNGINGDWSKTIPTVDEESIKLNAKFNIINHNYINNKQNARIQRDYWHRYKNDYIFNINEDPIYDYYNNDGVPIESIKNILPKLSKDDLNTKFKVQINSDEKPYENSDIIIVTSVTTNSRHYLSQKKALQTWLKTGLKTYSVNTKKEISILKNIYPEIETWIENDNLCGDFDIKSQYIQSLLDVAVELNKTILLLNSDIETYIQNGDLDNYPMIGLKHNYKKYLNQSSIEKHGIDAYLLPADMIKEMPRSPLAIGRPFWDYLLLYNILQIEPNLIVNSNPIFFHKEHEKYWTDKECNIGILHMKEKYNIEYSYDWVKWRLKLGYHNIK